MFTQATADLICERIATGESLRFICRAEDMPDKATVLRWLQSDERLEFRDQYARAREAQADHYFDAIIEIADDDTLDVNRSRLMVDARKWAAGKLRPKVYGDKMDLNHSGRILGSREMTEAELVSIAAGSSV